MMNSMDFLQNFPEQMKIAAHYGMLAENCVSRDAWTAFGFETFPSRYNLSIAVLFFIREMTSVNGECGVNDVADIIGALATAFVPELNLHPSRCEDLALFVIADVLANKGRLRHWPVYNFVTGKNENIDVAFISTKSDKETDRLSCEMTESGYIFCMSMQEIFLHSNVPVAQLIFVETMKKREYGTALASIKEHWHSLRMEIRSNEIATSGALRGIAKFSATKHRSRLDNSLAAIREANNELERYDEPISQLIEKFDGRVDASEEASGKTAENLRSIQKYLRAALKMKLAVINSHNAYLRALNNSFRNFWRNRSKSRLSIENDVFGHILGDASAVERLGEWILPLFANRLEKMLVPKQLLNFSRPQTTGSSVMPEPEDEADGWAWMEQMRIEKEKADALSSNVVAEILSSVRNAGGKTTLGQIWDEIEDDDNAKRRDERRQRFAPSIDVLCSVLLRLARGRSFHASEWNALQDSAEAGNGYADAGFLLRRVVETYPEHRSLVAFYIEPLLEEEVLFEGLDDGMENQKTLSCTDFVLKAKYAGEAADMEDEGAVHA